MGKVRLDKALSARGLAPTRSQAESAIRLGQVVVNGQVVTKPGSMVSDSDQVSISQSEQYVSRAGLKLASVAKSLNIDFRGKVVLDVGSSTGGFTDYALQNGASRVYAVDVGTNQMHPSLRGDQRIELHEKTDIRDYMPSSKPDIIVIDVSFISLRDILPHISRHIAIPRTEVVAMVKPQFEAGREQAHKGVIKNESVRRRILADFEAWVKSDFIIKGKRDSDVAGQKGNRERFYKLVKTG